MKNFQTNRLIVITRNDLNPGYQIAQTGHGIAQFLLENPELGKLWNNQYLISLSVKTKYNLENLLTKLNDIGIPLSYFTEPDLNDELTSICFIETDETKKFTNNLQLTLKN